MHDVHYERQVPLCVVYAVSEILSFYLGTHWQIFTLKFSVSTTKHYILAALTPVSDLGHVAPKSAVHV